MHHQQPRFALGVNSQTTPRASLEEFLIGAGQAGLPLVELAADILRLPLDEITELLASSRTSVLGVCPSAALLDWHWQWEAETGHQLEEELNRAAQLGAKFFVMPFMRPHGTAESIAVGLKLAVPIARALGMALAVEPIGHFDILRTARELAPILESQDPEVVGLLLDSFHFFRAGQDLTDLSAYDGVPIHALQVSNINDVPLAEAFGYRDRTFPLDGPMPVAALCEQVLRDRPEVPLIVEVIGDVAQRTPTLDGLGRASAQLQDIQNLLTTRKVYSA